MILINTLSVKADGPVLDKKLSPPETIETQTLQKRGLVWIKGQWQTINNKYEWKSGHWTNKKIGYVFIDGSWIESAKGWKWQDGYWKKINLNKWMSIYS